MYLTFKTPKTFLAKSSAHTVQEYTQYIVTYMCLSIACHKCYMTNTAHKRVDDRQIFHLETTLRYSMREGSTLSGIEKAAALAESFHKITKAFICGV